MKDKNNVHEANQLPKNNHEKNGASIAYHNHAIRIITTPSPINFQNTSREPSDKTNLLLS